MKQNFTITDINTTIKVCPQTNFNKLTSLFTILKDASLINQTFIKDALIELTNLIFAHNKVVALYEEG